jgi:hypothetical protein
MTKPLSLSAGTSFSIFSMAVLQPFEGLLVELEMTRT